MMLCRSCGRISPGEPTFCEGCGKSFNAAVCPAKHASSAGASHCSTCGSTELSEPAKGIRLSAPNRILAILVGLILFKIFTPLLPGLFGLFAKVIAWLFGAVLAPILWLILQLMLPLLIGWGMVGVCLQILSREKVNLYKIYVALSKRLFDALLVAARLFCEFLIRLVFAKKKRE